MMNTTRRSKERGQELLEFALIFPVLFTLLLGVLDMGRAVYYNSVLYNAAREGARYAIIYPDDTAGIEAAVHRLAVGLDPSVLTITTTVTTMPNEDRVQVALSYSFTPVTPLVANFFGASEVPLASQATMRVER